MTRENQWKLLDNYRRKLFLKNEIKYFFLKSVLTDSRLPATYRYYAIFKRTKLSRNGSSALLQNRCVRTGRVWSVKKYANYSRFFFRTESYSGNLPGFQRASW